MDAVDMTKLREPGHHVESRDDAKAAIPSCPDTEQVRGVGICTSANAVRDESREDLGTEPSRE